MKKTRKKVKIRFVDRILLFIIIVITVSSPVVIVYSKSKLSKSNIELERLKSKIEKQETINESISMKINELASLSNIQEIAKMYNLSYQYENIIDVK